jgi:cell division protein ZipA
VDIKDLILIGGGVLVAAIIAHGLWIAWRARRDPLRLAIDPKLIAAVGDNEPGQADFPNGGARVIERWGERVDDSVGAEPAPRADERASRPAASATASGRPAGDSARAERGTAERSTAERGPAERRAGATAPAARSEPQLGAARPADTVAPAEARAAAEATLAGTATSAPAPAAPTGGEHGARPVERQEREVRSEIRVGESAKRDKSDKSDKSDKGDQVEGLRAGVARRAHDVLNKALGNRTPAKPTAGSGTRSTERGASAGAAQAAGPGDGAPEDLILINVLAPREQPFTGTNLVDAFRANGLRYGDMNIFHRLDPVTRANQFSVANIIEPGTFDMAEVEDFRTPGICFFMRLPGPEHPVDAFEDLHRVARDVAERLGGELKDERRSVLTGQTVEHYRHRVAEFCRRRMSMRA